MNITNGRYVYMRNPVNDDFGPLHAYTAMPVAGLNQWFPRETHERIEMGRYFGHTYNLPLYKVPVEGKVPHAHEGEASFQGRHQLFDLEADEAQLSPITDAALEKHFAERIVHHLLLRDAPPEQFERLGLTEELETRTIS